MRAVWLRKFGGPEVLVAGDAPDPVPGEGRALVEVEFANITFVETQMRSGTGPMPVRLEPPVIPGNGVGGVVTAVGDGVDGTLVGRRVVSSTGGTGGYAEKVAVDAEGLFEVPDGLALDDAVALLADGRTATMMTRAARPREGERVLVEAAAGGVGTLLVQLAKAQGATVVAAARGARKTELVMRLGADEAVDYGEPGWAEKAGPVDVVFDGVGGDVAREAFGLLRKGGRMVSFGLASGEWASIPEEDARERGVALVRPTATPEELREFTRHALREAAAGRIEPVIGQRFPLDDAAGAHAAIESRGTVGKTLLEVSPPS
ncbi:zinc-binding dehydrogenase [Actinomadura citrea]|uniref:NADPH2:quinone reductase n=1 Tax=Actinomadura citrea TaxID=46158 RepID=A0A7Y9G7W6_9ACTN|nr:zinc-binding dehydrogenase [Actinomadura citrea]NYE11537.1 NADPH2:quinone reductase [Actinomadura citrea]GGT87583.1 NADPH:quinone reductase [Actinomadura citrea]